MTKMITCVECDEVKPHEAHGLCRRCYQRIKHQQNPEKINKRRRRNNHLSGRQQPMNENKGCSAFLGVHLTEHILTNVLKNIDIMPYGFKGYDFIDSDGYKVDIKSSCEIIRKGHANSWKFKIKKNTTPDYFLCLAWDNRIDLNPLYCWLIPGKDVNNKTGISIVKSTLTKWDKYKFDVLNQIKSYLINYED